MSRPPLDAWQAEFLRATAFSNDVIPPSYVDELWKKVVNTDAESVTRKPALGTFSASGTINNATLTLSISPGRIDWVATPSNVEAALVEGMGKYVPQDELFGDRLSAWFQFPGLAINRLAFGALLRLPVATRVAAYKALGEFLPRIKPDPDTSRDFLYQINRPRESKVVAGLTMNRLTKWAAVELNVGLIGSNKTIVPTLQFVRLELDISTDKDWERDLSRDKGLRPLYREMQSLSQELAREGDVP
jgi:hypothetical protein